MTDVSLIVGPPGTGKTHALCGRAERAAARRGAGGVVICSLTRTAAKEIAARAPIPAEAVGTLHAHAYRALGRPPLAESAEGLAEWNAAHPEQRLGAARSSLDDIDSTQAIDDHGHTTTDMLHQAVANHRARLTAPERWSAAERDHHRRWCAHKRASGRLDFADLIEQATANTDRHPAHPHTLLGDEAQDFSAAELALFRRWARGADEAILAGDPDQTLYAWRGADPHAFDRIPQRTVLGRSHRVPGAVHAAAVRWISQIADRRAAPYAPRPERGHIETLDTALREPAALLAPIEADLAAGRSVMVLATCAYMLAPLLDALRAAGIPHANPLRPERGDWNPMRGAWRLAAYLRPREDVWGEAARAWTWGDLRAWTEPLAARSALTRGAKALIDAKCRPDRLGATRADEEADLEAVCSLLGDSGTLTHPALRCDVGWWRTHLRATQRATQAYPLAVYERREPRALVAAPRLCLGTIHAVKGGEASSVYLAPDLSPTAMWHGWLAGGAAREHVVRTLYVGLTRARENVRVLSPSGPDHAAPLTA